LLLYGLVVEFINFLASDAFLDLEGKRCEKVLWFFLEWIGELLACKLLGLKVGLKISAKFYFLGDCAS
jgi:hypothetical protein